jgi:AcrR family transcriptional regulator
MKENDLLTSKLALDTNYAQPRKPERANGKLRYDALLRAAESLLEDGGAAHLTIQKLAKMAKVPMASVYHFFPSPEAVSVALAETYFAGFANLVQQPVLGRENLSWQDIVAIFMARTVTFYRDHRYAQTLVLGSDQGWHIRRADLENNRVIGEAIFVQICDKFPPSSHHQLRAAIIIGISIGDAVLSLSVAQHDTITPHFADEARIAVVAYLTMKFEPPS